MPTKKGQVTLFVVLAVIIVATVALFIVLKPGIMEKKLSEEEARKFLAPQIEDLRIFMSDCVKKVSLNYFEQIGLHGGYYKYESLDTIDFAGDKVVVAYRHEADFVNVLPSLSLVCGQGFDIYMEDEGYQELDKCTKDFKTFKKLMEVEEKEKIISAECEEDSIIIRVEWPISVKKADVSLDVKSGNVKLLVPLGKVMGIANDIISEEVQGNEFETEVLSNYIKKMGEKLSKMELNMQHYPGPHQIVYYLNTKPDRRDEKPYAFYFAVNRA